MEHRFYTRVRESGITYITISHRPALIRFHDAMLTFDGNGGWSYAPIDREQMVDDVDSDDDNSAAAAPRSSTARSTAATEERQHQHHHHEVVAQSPPSPASSSTAEAPSSSSSSSTSHRSSSLSSLTPSPRPLRRMWADLVRVLWPRWQCLESGLLSSVAAVVIARVALSERIAMLNGEKLSGFFFFHEVFF